MEVRISAAAETTAIRRRSYWSERGDTNLVSRAATRCATTRRASRRTPDTRRRVIPGAYTSTTIIPASAGSVQALRWRCRRPGKSDSSYRRCRIYSTPSFLYSTIVFSRAQSSRKYPLRRADYPHFDPVLYRIKDATVSGHKRKIYAPREIYLLHSSKLAPTRFLGGSMIGQFTCGQYWPTIY